MATHSLTGRHELSNPAAGDLEHLASRGFTPAPRFIQWMATLRCDLSCPHCLAAGREMPDMPLAAVERLLDEVAAMGIGEFLVTGGEPCARQDLPEVVGMLRKRGIRWTLNTAAAPAVPLRRAIERHPPAFVAVSLDGPASVHDGFRGRAGAFREALEAIAFYRSVVSGEVVAGTTVTRRNFAHLDETFAEVVRSGATAWGLHLLVPEGRARGRRDLFLRKRELRAIVDFCVDRRHHFPVGMADEIGYLGEEEPLLRDQPFMCGAGRTQCVVLPDGEVVPCTTLDRSMSAGNVLTRPLAEIWAEGFAELRDWRPEGRCRSCEYARACRGGCWLQRRGGTQCFRSLWRPPRLVGAAAAAVCLGLSAPALGGEPADDGKKPPVQGEDTIPDVDLPPAGDVGTLGVGPGGRTLTPEELKAREERQKKCVVEGAIVRFYVDWDRRGTSGSGPNAIAAAVKALGDDPAAAYLAGFVDPKRGRQIAERCRAVTAGLETSQVSLSLAALMWRDLAEVCLDGKPAAERTPEEQKSLGEAVAALEARSAEWQKRIFEEKLGTFLFRELNSRSFMSKAGPPAHVSIQYALGAKRWGRNLEVVTADYIAAHPFGESMQIDAACAPDAGLVLVRGGKESPAGTAFKLGVFDLLRTPGKAGAREEGPALALVDRDLKVAVRLPAGCLLAYADVLRLAYEQNRAEFDAKVAERWSWPLALAAWRAALGEGAAPDGAELEVRIAALVADLGNADWAAREAASAGLRKLGSAALPALKKATASADPEVKTRAEELVEELEKPGDDRLRDAKIRLVSLWLF